MKMTDEFKHPLYNEIHKRIKKKHQNVLILIVGDPGTGKSLLALRLASKIDSTFTYENVRERVVVQPEQFGNIIAEDGESRLPEGSAIIVDEAGAAALGSRDWYSIGNKMISYILQTFRYRQLVVIMTVPNMSFIDVHARKLVNFLIQTEKIDFRTNRTKTRVWKLLFNKVSGDGEPYRQRFTEKDEYGETVTLDELWFDRCDIKLVHAYEKYSYEFKQQIAEKALKSIMRVKENDKKKHGFDAKEIAIKIMQNKDRYFKVYHDKHIPIKGLIESDFNIGDSRAKRVMSLLKANGGVSGDIDS